MHNQHIATLAKRYLVCLRVRIQSQRCIGGGVMSLRVPTSLRLWTICVSRDMTSGTRRDAQGRSSKKGAKMISTTH